MSKTVFDPRQTSLLGLMPDPEPASAELEETWRKMTAADAANRKRSVGREQTVEHMKTSAPRMPPKDDKKWKAPPAFADGTGTVTNKKRRRP